MELENTQQKSHLFETQIMLMCDPMVKVNSCAQVRKENICLSMDLGNVAQLAFILCFQVIPNVFYFNHPVNLPIFRAKHVDFYNLICCSTDIVLLHSKDSCECSTKVPNKMFFRGHQA